MAEVIVFAYDHLDKVLSLSAPELTQRVLAFCQKYFDEGDPALMTRQMFGRVVVGDPSILLLAAVRLNGELVGHCLATLEQHGGRVWVFVWQCQMDKGSEEATPQMLAQLKEWGRKHDASNLIMVTDRSERAWQKKYGFESRRVLMTQSLEKEVSE